MDKMMRFTPTDYSNSPMSADRAKLVNKCELEYINGVPDENGNIEWPTYRGLASKYSIPLQVVNEQAAKHRWNARRERRKGQLVLFKNEQMQRQWLEMDREFTINATEALNKLQFVHSRAIHEAYQEAVLAWGKDADAAAKGSRELHKMNVKPNEVHTMTKAMKELLESQAARALKAQSLPLIYDEIQLPKELPTAQEEQAQLEEAISSELPPADVLDIFRMMNDMQLRVMDRLDNNKVISGEVDNAAK